VGTFSIGDMAAEPNDYLGSPAGSSTAAADFSGGSVDIRADSIYVGRSAADTGTGGSFNFGFGTFTIERGIVDVNNLYIAYKQGTNLSSSLNGSSSTLPCPLTVKSNAQMTVNGNVVMAFRNNGTNGSQIPYGALIVNDSATVNVGGNVTTPTMVCLCFNSAEDNQYDRRRQPHKYFFDRRWDHRGSEYHHHSNQSHAWRRAELWHAESGWQSGSGHLIFNPV
jgi:hypothetical protein